MLQPAFSTASLMRPNVLRACCSVVPYFATPSASSFIDAGPLPETKS